MHTVCPANTAALLAVHALPLRGGGILHQRAVEILAPGCTRTRSRSRPRRTRCDLRPARPLPRLFGGCALHGHGVPLPEQLARPCRRDAAVFQRDRPAARSLAVHLQRALVPPRIVRHPSASETAGRPAGVPAPSCPCPSPRRYSPKHHRAQSSRSGFPPPRQHPAGSRCRRPYRTPACPGRSDLVPMPTSVLRLSATAFFTVTGWAGASSGV